MSTLTPKWVFTTGGDVSATPTVDGNAVYFPDWGGNLFAVEKNSGHLIWSHKISEYDGVEELSPRVSPAVDGNQVIIGDILEFEAGPQWRERDRSRPANRHDPMDDPSGHPSGGDHHWIPGCIRRHEHWSFFAKKLALNPAYPCCSCGSIVALDEKSGAMRWKTFDMPDNGGQPGGYSGGAIWQPPAIDPKRGTLFIGTGNNYTAPADVEAGFSTQLLRRTAPQRTIFLTLLALDLKSGQIKWSKKCR